MIIDVSALFVMLKIINDICEYGYFEKLLH